MLRSEQDARDVTQDTLVRALRNLRTYELTRPFAPWIFRIARNACIDVLRKRKTRRSTDDIDIPDTGLSPFQRAATARRAQHLDEAMGHLSDTHREIIILYHFEHLKYTEIAEALDIPMGTVMNRIFRARQQLREIYKKMGGEQ